MDDHPWRTLAAAQAGLLARRQLNTVGFDADRVRNQITAGRWVELTSTVVATTTGPLSREQQLWLGVLHAGPGSALSGLTALEQHGLSNWPRPEVSVIVHHQRAFDPVPGIGFVRTRRPREEMTQILRGLPVWRVEPAALLFAAYEKHLRTAQGILAAVVQQRLTTAGRLLAWLEAMRPLRRARTFRGLLGEIEGGAHSVAELDVRRMCRRFGLPLPARQRRRRDRSGRIRWTDSEWDLPDGRVVILEVDGRFHEDTAQYGEDMRRQRKLTTLDRLVVRCSAFELRHETACVAEDLIALGILRSCA